MSRTHVVQSGDCLFTIARQYGFSDWRTIYDHPDNAAFKRKRKNPNVIFPGDEIKIPELNEKQVTVATGQAHRFQVNRLRTMLRVAIRDEEGTALAGKPFRLLFAGRTLEGTTTGEGLVEQELPDGDGEAQLTVWRTADRDGGRYFWNLRVGHLDPIDETPGVRQRLNNLGFYAGSDEDEDEGEASAAALRLALRGFQELHGLRKSGEIDDATKAKLVELHGGV